uniref:Uncharacterized protein n=1 Tax=mine drainage metagenome TaxID=410659 RepID=E6QWG7_9ZZZZ
MRWRALLMAGPESGSAYRVAGPAYNLRMIPSAAIFAKWRLTVGRLASMPLVMASGEHSA